MRKRLKDDKKVATWTYLLNLKEKIMLMQKAIINSLYISTARSLVSYCEKELDIYPSTRDFQVAFLEITKNSGFDK